MITTTITTSFYPFNDAVMTSLQSIAVINVKEDYSDKLNKFVNNIVIEQKFKPGHPRYRTKEMIESNSEAGIGGEEALLLTGHFKEYSPAVENAKSNLSYADRQIDLTCEDRNIQVKTLHMKSKAPTWYISQSTRDSLMNSSKYCDVLIVVGYELLKDYIYRYTPLWMIDLKALAAQPGYFRKNEYDNGRIGYEFNEFAANKRNILIDLRIL